MIKAFEALRKNNYRHIRDITKNPTILLGIATVVFGFLSIILAGVVLSQPAIRQHVDLRLSFAMATVLAFGCAAALSFRSIWASFVVTTVARKVDRLVDGNEFKERIEETSLGSVDVLVQKINGLLDIIDAKHDRIGEMTEIIFQREQENQVLWLEIEHNLCLAKEEAERDGLTNLYNRNSVDQRFDYELEKAKHGNYPLTVLMADLDHFKRVNDTYGHQVGDEVLKIFAKTLTETLRIDDIAARYGGEEFIVVLPNTNVHDAILVAGRINIEFKLAVERELARIDGLFCTVSIGVADYPALATTNKDLVAAADAALYDAKENGRNRVVYYLDIAGSSYYDESIA